MVIFMNLTKADLISLGKGLIIALIGAALTYLTAWISKTSFGEWTPFVVAFWGFVANIIRKYIDAPVLKATGTQL